MLEAQGPSALSAGLMKENVMREISELELGFVSGGNARDTVTGSFLVAQDYGSCGGNPAGSSGGSCSSNNASVTASLCTTVQIGAVATQTCIGSDGSVSIQTCLQAGPSATVFGVGAGVVVQACTTASGRY